MKARLSGGPLHGRELEVEAAAWEDGVPVWPVASTIDIVGEYVLHYVLRGRDIDGVLIYVPREVAFDDE